MTREVVSVGELASLGEIAELMETKNGNTQQIKSPQQAAGYW
jgi:hypothetical protein